jgi:hypothetical protein
MRVPRHHDEPGSRPVKKGRHRRFEEARALKRSHESPEDAVLTPVSGDPCPECNAAPGKEHASWCLHEDDEPDEDDGWG